MAAPHASIEVMNRQTCGARPGFGRVLAARWAVTAWGVIAMAAGPALAAPAQVRSVTTTLTADGVPGVRVSIDTPVTATAMSYATISPTIYLERCRGGCKVHQGPNDARTNTSTIPVTGSQHPGLDFTVGEFATSTGQVGTAANNDWTAVVTCMKEVYSPFGVTVTDARPTSGTYHEVIIAGRPQDIGLTSDILGVAPLSNDCSPIDDVMSFTFANNHTVADASDLTARRLSICWTAAQESAHAFGLDHEYSFVTGNEANGHSACNDPMTYRGDCGGEKFFRNEIANCGEVSSRECKCTKTQNSHQKLLTVFGAGTPITKPPSSRLASLASGGMLGNSVSVQAGAQRGVARVALYFNGFPWAEQLGVAFQSRGQPDPSSYNVAVPASLPNSIVDVKAIAYDDLGVATESTVVTVTKGAPCTSASTCAKGQKCEAGKCFWDPAVGEIGDSCSYAQFCKSGLCSGSGDDQLCSQNCTVDPTADSCPDGFACVASGTTTTSGTCQPSDNGGCCSAGGQDRRWWVHAGLAALVLGMVARRRRRR